MALLFCMALSYTGVVIGSRMGFSAVVDRQSARLSICLEKTGIDMVPTTTMLKSVFLEVDVAPLAGVSGHTHADSAAKRSTASLLIDRVCESAVLTPEWFQGSAADQRKGRMTSRYLMWAKDQMAYSQPRPIEETNATVMVDVDYYLDDLPNRLCDNFRPYLLYTFVPSKAARDDGEYKYTFNEDGTVTYTVAGGGSYRHKLWDWDGDSLAVTSKIFGITWKYATYAVERRFIDEDHQVILLAPLRKWTGLMSWFAKSTIKAKNLERLDPRVAGFARLIVNQHNELCISTAKLGGYCCATVPRRVDDALASAIKTMSGKPTMGTVKSKMDDSDYNAVAKHRGAEILLEYHTVGGTSKAHVSVVGGLRRFQWIPPGETLDEDAKPGMVPFMKPLLDGGFVPDVCKNNDATFVRRRCTEMRSQTAMSNYASRMIDEFVDQFLPLEYKHTMYPVEEDVVYERQAKPSQRAILNASQHESPTDVTKQFMKREAYSKVTDPRGISTINGVTKRQYSAYIYAITEHIKKQPWYAFGKPPAEVAQRVADICEANDWVDCMDFNRMDGRVSIVLRELERRAMMRAFVPECHIHLYQLMRQQFCLRARTACGVVHKTVLERLSGSAETSGFNTLATAFVNYVAYRNTLDAYGGQPSPEQAYSKLGIYGGDDGLSGGLSAKAAQKASELVGQVLDLDRVYRHDRFGVKFLARHYGPDVWFGVPDSVCDIRRQLSKFHLTVHLPSNISRVDKIREKAFAFSLTDGNTPVIGEFVRRVLELYPVRKNQFRNKIQLYGVELDPDRQYPNQDGGDWMQDYIATQLTDFDLSGFREWLRTSDGNTIFDPPGFADPVPTGVKSGVVCVDGDIVAVPGPEPEPTAAGERDNAASDGSAGSRARRPRSECRGARMGSRRPKPKVKRANPRVEKILGPSRENPRKTPELK